MRFVLFDVDGTLVDSQAHIVGSMAEAFRSLDLPAPTRAQTLSIVGLSLPQAMATLAPGGPVEALVEAYKKSYQDLRASHGEAQGSPLYAGIRELLHGLHAEPETLLGVATGKSKRGLDHVMETRDLAGFFITRQDADGHPSKPHPSMAMAALGEAGLETGVMVGDTTFDMEMGRAAGMATVAVTWGYHPPERLAPLADRVVSDMAALRQAIDEVSP
ncbi:MAG: HAD-IA family hydrolase [Pseudomonadota bacterium]